MNVTIERGDLIRVVRGNDVRWWRVERRESGAIVARSLPAGHPAVLSPRDVLDRVPAEEAQR